MKTVISSNLEAVPSKVIFFLGQVCRKVGAAMVNSHADCLLSASTRGMALFALPSVLGPNDPFDKAAATPSRRPKKISNTQTRMEGLFALMRREKPPGNFFGDFIQEFHRRIEEPSATLHRPSASTRKLDS